MSTPTLQDLQSGVAALGAARDAVDTATKAKTDADQAVSDAQANAAKAAQALPSSEASLAKAENDLITLVKAFVSPELGSTDTSAASGSSGAASGTPSTGAAAS